MRGIVLVVTMVLTLYAAGMFRNLPLLALFFVELFVILLMKIITVWFYLSVRCRFVRGFAAVKRGEQINCGIEVTNRSMLPVARMRVKSVYKYFCETKEHDKYMYGAADRGKTRLDFSLRFNYAGMAEIKLNKITLYDYLSIFSSERKTADIFKAAVFPDSRAIEPEGMSWDMVNFIRFGGGPQKNTDNIHDTRDEIRQVREYGYGDPLRDIHWNLSARMDGLWVREYDDESIATAELFLDLRCEEKNMDIAAYDSFFCVLTSLLMGMLERVRMVKVSWFGGTEESVAAADVCDYESCCDMLLMLYNTDFTKIDVKAAGKYIASMDPGAAARMFWFDTQLNWRIGGMLLHRFNPSEKSQSS